MHESQSKSEQDIDLPEDGEDLVSAEDAERINRILGRVPDAAVPDVDALSGLLTAFVCGPKVVSYQYIMKIAMMSNSSDEEIVWDGPDEAVWFIQFLRRYLIDLHHLLSDDSRTYKPCIRCKTRPGNHWARGFTLAATFQREDWDDLVFNEDYNVEMGVISVLSKEQSKNSDDRIKSTEEIEEHRSDMLEYLPHAVTRIFDYFTDQRDSIGENYPKYLAEVKITVSDPDDDDKPEAERFKKQFIFNEEDDGQDVRAQSETKRKKKKGKKGRGKSKRKRW